MTARRALVLLDDGKEGELPVGDTLEGAGSSSAPTLSQIAQEILSDSPGNRVSDIWYDEQSQVVRRIFSPSPVTTAITAAYGGWLAEIGWIVGNSGTGAGVTRPTANSQLLALNTGTTASGQCTLQTGYAAGPEVPAIGDFTPGRVVPKGNVRGWVSRVTFDIPALSTSAQEFRVFLPGGISGGFSPSSPGSEEFTLQYTRTASVNWRIAYRGGIIDTGIPVNAGGILEFVVYAERLEDLTYAVRWGLRNSGSPGYSASGTITDAYINTSAWRAETFTKSTLLQASAGSITASVGTTTKVLRIHSYSHAVLLSPP